MDTGSVDLTQITLCTPTQTQLDLSSLKLKLKSNPNLDLNWGGMRNECRAECNM